MDLSELLSDFPNGATQHVEIGKIYQLNHSSLSGIIEKINSVKPESSNICLRKNGIQIFGESRKGYLKVSHPIGMIVAGSHLGKEPSDIYLITFNLIERDPDLKPTFNLLHLLREFIYLK